MKKIITILGILALASAVYAITVYKYECGKCGRLFETTNSVTGNKCCKNAMIWFRGSYQK